MCGFRAGGLNFDSKVRRESTDLEGLLNAAKLVEDGRLDALKKARYSSWIDDKIGVKVEGGKSSFADLEAYAIKNEPKPISGKQGTQS
ncbi:UNVERIFIED_CONTAM: hypothetical protein HDU68_000599 [Siphonaria sp. JEL0065]|nr:hypothetical protein HDU68_000599 [Siphonaria sp. JEL0065]